jgi:phosphocarrier protein HPr
MEITEKLRIINRLGFHLRAVAVFVKTTSKFKCKVLVKYRDGHVNGKSLMNLLILAAGYGAELTLVFDGEDATEARDSIKGLFLNKFGEKE